MNVMKGKHSRGLSILLSLVLAVTMLLPTGFAQTANAEETLPDGLYLYLPDTGEIVSEKKIEVPISVNNADYFVYLKQIEDGNEKIIVAGKKDASAIWSQTQFDNNGKNTNFISSNNSLQKGSIKVSNQNSVGKTGRISVTYDQQETYVDFVPYVPFGSLSNEGETITIEPGATQEYIISPATANGINEAFVAAREDFVNRLQISSSNTSMVGNDDITLKWNDRGANAGKLSMIVSPKSTGTTELTVTYRGEEYKTTLKVESWGIKLTKSSVDLRTDGTTQLPVSFDNGYENSTITWTSSDPSVATVDSEGNVTAVAQGNATITASIPKKEEDGEGTFEASCTVRVYDEGLYRVESDTDVRLMDIDFNKAELVENGEMLNLSEGEHLVLQGAVQSTGEVKELIQLDARYYSDNTSVLKNDSSAGVYYANFVPVANGTANVYVCLTETEDGYNYPTGRSTWYKIPVTVSGMDSTAAPVKEQLTELTDDDTVQSVSNGSIQLKEYAISVNPYDETGIANYITGETFPTKGNEFQFQIINTNSKFKGGGVVIDDEAIANFNSEEYATAYAKRLGQFVKLLDKDGNIVATNGDGMTIKAKTSASDNHPTADVTITIDSALNPNQEYGYTLAFDTFAPMPWADAVTTFNHAGLQNAVSYTFSTAKGDIADCTVDPVSDQTYTGKASKPALTVKDGGKTLKEGTDYTVEYKNNTAVGTAIATIKGKGDYEGTQEVTFKIVEKKDNSSDNNSTDSKDNNHNNDNKKDTTTNKVTVGKAKMGTTGFYKAKAIKVKVKKKAKNATIYKYSIRKASATKWTNKWSKKKTYKFKKLENKELYQLKVAGYTKKNGVKGDDSKISYRYMSAVTKKAKGGKKKVTVTWKKDGKASGYEIRYATSKKALKNATIIKVSKGKTKKVIKNLKKGKKYYVQVRPYKNYKGHKYNGIWWTKSAKTK